MNFRKFKYRGGQVLKEGVNQNGYYIPGSLYAGAELFGDLSSKPVLFLNR